MHFYEVIVWCAALAQCGQILSKKASLYIHERFLNCLLFSKIDCLFIKLSREIIGMQEFEFDFFR